MSATEVEVPPQQVAELLLALARTRRWVTRLAGNEPAVLGMSGVSALAEIRRSGPIRLGDLAARERIAPPTLSRIMAGLVEQGYAERTPDPDDARAGLVRITEAGEELLGGLRSRRAAELAARLARLTPEDRDAILGAASALRRLLDED